MGITVDHFVIYQNDADTLSTHLATPNIDSYQSLSLCSRHAENKQLGGGDNPTEEVRHSTASPT
ncbi:hypothetical protein BDFB_005542 [Asbolus verrucosus]|uniref:Uncharacterized protein n=1 Tax=Asbolus verrucosus TaxID=1661398 RepID=A0A482W2U0_ASBVE|nr:hypothetical protein BDFB_005542 [Asbolus verrucosus]